MSEKEPKIRCSTSGCDGFLFSIAAQQSDPRVLAIRCAKCKKVTYIEWEKLTQR